MKRKALIALLISAVIISSSALIAGQLANPPLHNKWEKGYTGKILSSLENNGSLYVLTALANNVGQNFSYSVYKFNFSTGFLYWTANTYAITGSVQSLSGPLMQLYNNTIYLKAFNDSLLGNAYSSSAGSFDLVAVNISSGSISHYYRITPHAFSASETIGYNMLMMGSNLSVSFVNYSYNPDYPLNSTFEVYSYSLGNTGPVLSRSSSIMVPYVNGWGPDYENIYTSGTDTAYCLNSIGKAYIYGPGTANLISFSGQAIGFSGSDLYYGVQDGSNFTVKAIDVHTSVASSLFTLREYYSQNETYSFQGELFPGGVISVTVTSDHYGVIGNPGSSPYIWARYMGFSGNGSMIWNQTLTTGLDYSATVLQPSGGNALVFTVPIVLGSAVEYSSRIIALNYTTGNEIFNIDYHYSVHYPVNNLNLNTPYGFAGISLIMGDYFVYSLGDKIACAELT